MLKSIIEVPKIRLKERYSEKKKLEKSEKEYLYLDVKENLSKELKFNKYEYFVENFNQACARIVISNAEVKLAERGIPAVLQVHDELIFVVRDEHVDAVSKAIKLVMEQPVPWLSNLPVECDIAHAQNYGDAK